MLEFSWYSGKVFGYSFEYISWRIQICINYTYVDSEVYLINYDSVFRSLHAHKKSDSVENQESRMGIEWTPRSTLSASIYTW